MCSLDSILNSEIIVNLKRVMKTNGGITVDDFTKKRIIKIMDQYIQKAVPEHVKTQMKISYTMKGNNVTLIEERKAFQLDVWVQLPIAQFRLDKNQWKVYWRDSKERWHFVDDIEPVNDFEKQLEIVDQGHKGMF